MVRPALSTTNSDACGRGGAQRAAVLKALSASGRFRTAQDLYAEMRASGSGIGLTTVYRHLQKLAEEGVIHTLQTADRQTAYRRCSENSHHHLVCVVCNDGIEIGEGELDRWVEGEAANRGFSDITHSVEIFGVCPACAATSRAGSAGPGSEPALRNRG